MLDPEKLRSYMDTFYGYGSWSASLWFVGMEEGGGEALEEIERRLAAWDGDELEDLREFHERFGESRWFGDRPKIQSTWGKLIRIALASQGVAPDNDAVRAYQRDRLGRRSGDTALIELFPLPSPSTAHWTYAETCIPELATRETYYAATASRRIETIRARIAEHHPRAVVLYGLGHRAYWEQLAAAPFEKQPNTRFETQRLGATQMIITPHPVTTGIRNEDFDAIGRFIAERLS